MESDNSQANHYSKNNGENHIRIFSNSYTETQDSFQTTPTFLKATRRALGWSQWHPTGSAMGGIGTPNYILGKEKPLYPKFFPHIHVKYPLETHGINLSIKILYTWFKLPLYTVYPKTLTHTNATLKQLTFSRNVTKAILNIVFWKQLKYGLDVCYCLQSACQYPILVHLQNYNSRCHKIVT